MRDILAFVPILITLIAGVLGVCFGKTGEQNKLARVSYVFIALMVAAAAYGVYDLQAAAAERKAANAAAASKEEALKSQVATARRMLELDSFDLTRPFEYGLFYIEIGVTPDGEPITLPGFTGPFPTFGRPMQGEIRLEIDNVFSYEYKVRTAAGGAITLTRDGAQPMTLTANELSCYQGTAGQCPNDGSPPLDGDWWVDLLAPNYSHGVKLGTRASLHKLIARAMGEESYGHMIFRIPELSDTEHARAAAAFKEMEPDVKLYAPLRAGVSGGCLSAIHLPVTLRVEPRSNAARDTITVDILPARERFSTVECEEPPF